MNLSLKNRITLAFVVANIVVLITGFTMFFYLDRLNADIEETSLKNLQESILVENLRLSSMKILKLKYKTDWDGMKLEVENFQSQINKLSRLYEALEIKVAVTKMQGFSESIVVLLSSSDRMKKLSNVDDLADKLFESIYQFQDLHSKETAKKENRIKESVGSTKKQMMITLIIMFLGTLLLGFVIPNQLTLPFRKINQAIRELQDYNFDVNIFYNHEDEIGNLAREINKMIASMKVFEELRADRIQIENRKFDILANLSQKHILLTNQKAEVVYMNNSLYKALEVNSDDVLNRDIHDSALPQEIIDLLETAVKKQSKVENFKISLGTFFDGFTSVFPIRGRNHDQHYYLVLFSPETLNA